MGKGSGSYHGHGMGWRSDHVENHLLGDGTFGKKLIV
jgi:hypothetical protein